MAAILFPVFQKVRENARRTVCISNVKQIELGLIQYTQDHNGKYPSAANFKSAVFPYVKSEPLFHCPDNASGGTSYSLNKKLQGTNTANLSDPSQVVAVYEGKNQTLDFRHDGYTVVGFADGHVRVYRPEQVSMLQWKP